MTGNKSGFSFVELMVVMFILSLLAFFTVPYFVSPGEKAGIKGSLGLAGLMTSLKHRAVRDNRDYLLHLDQVAGKAWVTVRDPEAQDKNDEEDSRTLTGLSLSGVELLNQGDPELSDTIIRFYSRGYSDTALIRMAGEDGESVTLKLHPFLSDPEIIRGHVSFDDCI
ncbi:MAG: prepilin-type N-terminal cleavage/methylation domain-containing protein [Desulfobacterales bacterium]|nr:prepilin-type N-terminal cleavage/methylation domain-containing protein [Desulfobacterales bacterium]